MHWSLLVSNYPFPAGTTSDLVLEMIVLQPLLLAGVLHAKITCCVKNAMFQWKQLMQQIFSPAHMVDFSGSTIYFCEYRTCFLSSTGVCMGQDQVTWEFHDGSMRGKAAIAGKHSGLVVGVKQEIGDRR